MDTPLSKQIYLPPVARRVRCEMRGCLAVSIPAQQNECYEEEIINW